MSGCYVHSSSTLTFHRRAYHLLSPETGTALYPVTSASKNNRNAPPSLILVHYLDTKVSAANCTALVQKGIDVNPTLYPSGGYPQNAMLAAVLQEPQSRPGQLQHIPENVQSQPQPLPVMSYNSNILDDDGDDDISNPFGAAFDATSHSLDNRTIDFLWDVVVEESSDDVRMHSSSLSELLTPEMIEKMFDSEGVGNIFENGELLNMKQSEMELKTLADTLTTNVQVSGVEVVEVMDTTDHHQHEDEVEIKFGEEAFMPELVDVTPEFVYLDRCNVKVVLSCSFSLPTVFDDNGGTSTWSQLACFIEANVDGSIDPSNLKVARIKDARMLNPYCYQCQLNQGFLMPGTYRIMIVAIRRLDDEVEHSQTEVTHTVSRLLQETFRANLFKMHLPPQCHTVSVEGVDGRILTQLSESSFQCVSAHRLPKHIGESEERSDESTNSSSLIRRELPAPPPAMALVATMLLDFPNPPPGAVLPPDTIISHADSKPNMTFEEQKASNVAEANAIFSNAMEATVIASAKEGVHSKKRSSSFIEIPRSANADDIGDGPTAASKWADRKSSDDPESDTKAEEVDRHCKIRFVERLTSVISETGGDALVKETLPENITTMEDDAIGKYFVPLQIRFHTHTAVY